MIIEDFDGVSSLWESIKGFAIRHVDDTEEGVGKFLLRNPGLSVVAVNDEGKVVGTILCGHDGRRAGFYHVCVEEAYRKHGIGQKMVNVCLEHLRAEGICKINLIAFTKNVIGNRFWQGLSWARRDDVHYYEENLNLENTVHIIE
ncbi:MAG: GNAT family N-acetyltransferase [Lachnospiraceae bacterium]